MAEQDWTFSEFDLDLGELKAHVREKALQIARKLVEERGMQRAEAIREAIRRAEEWFYDKQG